jgi:enoyl-CoA hydratase/carnithine racemase
MAVHFDVKNQIATITLDRPPVNALDRQHQDALNSAAREAAERPDVRAVLLCGAEAIFSAGADIAEMAGLSTAEMKAHAPLLQRAFMAIARIPQPVCAAIEGYALGGGLELALAADFRICSATAYVGLPEITLGVMPGAGGTQRLTRLVGPAKAKYMIMTGTKLGSDEAEQLGLVDQVVPPNTAASAARALLAPLATGPQPALRAVKQAIDPLGAGHRFNLETRLFADLFGTPDQVAGMAAFLAKREPEFR